MAATRAIPRLFVSNLPWTVSGKELREFFTQFGQVASASVVFNRDTGLTKGYGFLQFATKDAFVEATKQSKYNLEGNEIQIRLAIAADRDLTQGIDT